MSEPHCPTELPEELDRVQRRAAELGLQFLGVCPADPFSPEERTHHEAQYRGFLESGSNAGMSFLQKHEPLKYRAEAVLPNCRSVLLFGMNYYREDQIDTQQPGSSTEQEPRGRVARYARGRDYHKSFGGRLLCLLKELSAAFPEQSFRRFVDAGPLSERAYAAAAGGCVTGRNTLLISPQYGSYFFIGEILSTQEFPTTVVAAGPGCPPDCRACIQACPTGALYAPYEMDAGRCISYLTVEHKSRIPVELQPLLGDMVLGCDRCQDVCPLNAVRRITRDPDLRRSVAGAALPLRELLQLKDHADMVRRFGGSPVMRAGRAGMVRNACIVAANLGARELIPHISALCDDVDEVVAATARECLARLEE